MKQKPETDQHPLASILPSRTVAGFVATYGGWREMFWLGVPMALPAGGPVMTVLPHSPPGSRLGLANAIRDATGRRLRDLPLTPARIRPPSAPDGGCTP